ncbi:MAG: arginine deiminase-related protein, partial [Ferruginibacter sp.]
QAYQSLTPSKMDSLVKHNRIIHSALSNIETAGGGSARCMLAEIFLPVK